MTDRRSFLRGGASVLMAHAAFPGVMAAFAAAPFKPTFFNAKEMRTLTALVDVILPATDSPAASAANTHLFIDLAIPACASVGAQKVFRAGLAALAAKNFDRQPAPRQVELLKERVAKDMDQPYEQSFFKILKDYTMTGYFMSETGATQALAYLKIPGGFQGDLPLQRDQKAWAI